MQIRIPYPPYRARDYGKPYISKVVGWRADRKLPDSCWGKYIGNNINGGYVEIEAEPGDVIQHGRKDLCSKKGLTHWMEVRPDGTVREIMWDTVRFLWNKSIESGRIRPLSAESDDDLLAECRHRGLTFP